MDLEIATAFEDSSPFYLNRPLISILEHRGVKPAVFLALQSEAIKEVERIITSLRAAGRLLPLYGLGKSFDLSVTLLKLYNLTHVDDVARMFDLAGVHMGPFLFECLALSVLDIKRWIKFKARIPVDGCHLVVGVPDETGILKAGQVYCCVSSKVEGLPKYFNGHVLVFRSPTIHVRRMRFVAEPANPDSNLSCSPAMCKWRLL